MMEAILSFNVIKIHKFVMLCILVGLLVLILTFRFRHVVFIHRLILVQLLIWIFKSFNAVHIQVFTITMINKLILKSGTMELHLSISLVLQMIILALVLHVKGALDFVDIVKFIIHFYATVLTELTPLQIVSSHHLTIMVLEMGLLG